MPGILATCGPAARTGGRPPRSGWRTCSPGPFAAPSSYLESKMDVHNLIFYLISFWKSNLMLRSLCCFFFLFVQSKFCYAAFLRIVRVRSYLGTGIAKRMEQTASTHLNVNSVCLSPIEIGDDTKPHLQN